LNWYSVIADAGAGIARRAAPPGYPSRRIFAGNGILPSHATPPTERIDRASAMTTPSTARPQRPLSPHLQTYRWTLTMAMSIFHRATGVAMYVGTLLIAWWLLATASGPTAYAYVQGFFDSWIGRLILFGYTWALIHHLLSGLRHLVWDLGHGFGPSEREWLTRAALIGGIVLTILLWIVGYAMGGGR